MDPRKGVWRAVEDGDLKPLLRAVWKRRPAPRGVTVYTGIDAEHYKLADKWERDNNGVLDLFDYWGRQIATFLPNTWMRVEAGKPALSQPSFPRAEPQE